MDDSTGSPLPTIFIGGSLAPRAASAPYKCPVCDGTGLVSRPPGTAGDQLTFTSSESGPWPCGACRGTGVLWH